MINKCSFPYVSSFKCVQVKGHPSENPQGITVFKRANRQQEVSEFSSENKRGRAKEIWLWLTQSNKPQEKKAHKWFESLLSFRLQPLLKLKVRPPELRHIMLQLTGCLKEQQLWRGRWRWAQRQGDLGEIITWLRQLTVQVWTASTPAPETSPDVSVYIRCKKPKEWARTFLTFSPPISPSFCHHGLRHVRDAASSPGVSLGCSAVVVSTTFPLIFPLLLPSFITNPYNAS